MRQPDCLAPLVDQGIIQEIVRPVMSGKEAQIYLVVSGDELRVAKVYKEAQNRSFRQRAEYTEGRGVRSSRTQRAMSRRSRFGREQDDAGWRSTEVDVIYRLRAAGVRVPEPYFYGDGVLVMELVTDAQGEPAPRLADVTLGSEETREVFGFLLSSVVKMLCAGVVHGDLSEFNVLLGKDGPVVIDFPQAVDPAHNQNARKLLIRDVDNLTLFLGRTVPGRRLPYGQELWEVYARNELSPQTQLTGRWEPPRRKVDESAVLYEIDAAAREAQRRSEGAIQGPGRRRRKPRSGPQAVIASPTEPARAAKPEQPGKPTRPPQDARPTRSPQDARPTRPPQDARPTRSPQDARPTRSPQDARPTRSPQDARPTRSPQDARPARSPQDARPARPPQDARPARPPQDARPARPPQDARPTRPGAGPGGAPSPGQESAPTGERRRRRRRRRRAATTAPTNS